MEGHNHREPQGSREGQRESALGPCLPAYGLHRGLARGHADETPKGTGGQAEPLKFRLWGWGAGQGTEGIW